MEGRKVSYSPRGERDDDYEYTKVKGTLHKAGSKFRRGLLRKLGA
jgi:hypothetical protein